MIKPNLNLKTNLVATTLALSAFSLTAQAALTTFTNQGADLVYSSESDVTWTKDANLLSSLFASQGFSTVINNIIAASPIITNTTNSLSPTGSYTITTSDFSSNGQTTWFGAMAYVSYLNSISYGGSNQWRLPTFATFQRGYDTPTNGTTTGNELSELFYQELNISAGSQLQDTATFDNEQAYYYFSGTEYAINPNRVWTLATNSLAGGRQIEFTKTQQFYAWAVSGGRINTATPSAVPVPAAAWLFGSGLMGLAALKRRKEA